MQHLKKPPRLWQSFAKLCFSNFLQSSAQAVASREVLSRWQVLYPIGLTWVSRYLCLSCRKSLAWLMKELWAHLASVYTFCCITDQSLTQVCWSKQQVITCLGQSTGAGHSCRDGCILGGVGQGWRGLRPNIRYMPRKHFFAPSPWNILDMIHNFRQFQDLVSLPVFNGLKGTELQSHITWYDIHKMSRPVITIE